MSEENKQLPDKNWRNQHIMNFVKLLQEHNIDEVSFKSSSSFGLEFQDWVNSKMKPVGMIFGGSSIDKTAKHETYTYGGIRFYLSREK